MFENVNGNHVQCSLTLFEEYLLISSSQDKHTVIKTMDVVGARIVEEIEDACYFEISCMPKVDLKTNIRKLYNFEFYLNSLKKAKNIVA